MAFCPCALPLSLSPIITPVGYSFFGKKQTESGTRLGRDQTYGSLLQTLPMKVPGGGVTPYTDPGMATSECL